MNGRRSFILPLSSFLLLFLVLLIAAVASATVQPVSTPAPTRWSLPAVFTPTAIATAAPGWWTGPCPTPWCSGSQLTPTPTPGG